MKPGYVVSDDPDRLDHEWIWEMLSLHAYWLRWRRREDVEAQIASAWRVVGAYLADTGAQVGFARAVSDGVSFAYLGDVIVDPLHRGAGVGTAVIRAMIDDGPGADFVWTLFTADAHGLYERFGFGEAGERAMVRPPRRG